MIENESAEYSNLEFQDFVSTDELADGIVNVFANDIFLPDKKRKICSATVIRQTKNGKVGISLKDKGILVQTSEMYSKGDVVTVEYVGSIGKPDFDILALV